MAWGNQGWGISFWGEATNPEGPPANRKTRGQAEQAALLGTDVKFEGDYSVSNKGDYVLLEGEKALRQAVLHRLITKQGEFATRPSYGVGIRTYVKKKKTASNIKALEQLIVDQLGKEPRIEEVLEAVVESIDDGLKVVISIRASAKALRFQPFIFTELGESILES